MASDKPDHQRKAEAESENVIEEDVSEFESRSLHPSRHFILKTPDKYKKCTEKPNKNADKSLEFTILRTRRKESASNLMKSSCAQTVHLAQRKDRVEPATAKTGRIDRFQLEKEREKNLGEDEDRDVQCVDALFLQTESTGSIEVGLKPRKSIRE